MHAIMITGYLGKDAVLRHTSNQKPILYFDLASTERSKQGKQALWFKCSFWGETAEKLGSMNALKKGTPVFVDGTISAETYEGKKGIEVTLKCRVNKLDIMSKLPGDENESITE